MNQPWITDNPEDWKLALIPVLLFGSLAAWAIIDLIHHYRNNTRIEEHNKLNLLPDPVNGKRWSLSQITLMTEYQLMSLATILDIPNQDRDRSSVEADVYNDQGEHIITCVNCHAQGTPSPQGFYGDHPLCPRCEARNLP